MILKSPDGKWIFFFWSIYIQNKQPALKYHNLVESDQTLCSSESTGLWGSKIIQKLGTVC